MRRMLTVAVAIAIAATAVLAALAPPGAAAATDRPNEFATATRAAPSPQGPWLREHIASSRDVDWYKFVVTRAGHHMITLGGLPADYALELRSSTGAPVATQPRPGVRFEQLYRRLEAGTYYVRVRSVRGSSATKAYGLQFRRVPDSLHVLRARFVRPAGSPTVFITGELLNNTAQWRGVGGITVLYRNAAGRTIGSDVIGLYVIGPIAPRQRMPFDGSFNTPAGTASFAFVIQQGVGAPTPQSGLVLGSPTTQKRANTDYYWYRGTVTNRRATTARDLIVFVVRYNTWGGIHDFDPRPIMALAPGRTASYEALLQEPQPNFVVRWVYDMEP